MSMTNVLVMDKMKQKDVVVLNVLSPEAYAKMHIPGSYNVPWNNDANAFAKRVGQLYGKDKFYITHCSNVSCMAGPSAAKALRDNGFKAEDYAGGIEDWEKSGFPLEGIMAPHPAVK
jgi:rhodanese-related sulfurtransferase